MDQDTQAGFMQQAVASNDACFHQPKVRNSPIKSSMAEVDGLPKTLKIYRIAGSKYWQVRLYARGRYLSKSLKTTEREEALQLARVFFEEASSSGAYLPKAARPGELTLPQSQALLHDAVLEVLAQELEKVKRDEIKHGSYVMSKIRLEGVIFDFFKQHLVTHIDVEVLEQFIGHLTGLRLSASTMQGYIAQTRKVLRILHRQKILKAVPEFPALRSQPNSRGAFTLSEYKAILRSAKALQHEVFTDWPPGAKVWIRQDYHQMPVEMGWLIRFMVYTFVRPGDIRQIKNKHVEVIHHRHHYLRLNLPEVKRHKAPTVSLPPAVHIYEKLRAYQTARGYGGPEDYVFFPEMHNRRLVLDVAGWCFNRILKKLGLKQGPHGTDRSLYSLRHTAITFRLIYGGNIDLLTLARNARTSVEMIEKFYASTLSAEMNVALIHGRRRSPIMHR
jgi:integrase